MEHFRSLPDPRIHRTQHHSLIDILVIAVWTMLCGDANYVLALKGNQETVHEVARSEDAGHE